MLKRSLEKGKINYTNEKIPYLISLDVNSNVVQIKLKEDLTTFSNIRIPKIKIIKDTMINEVKAFKVKTFNSEEVENEELLKIIEGYKIATNVIEELNWMLHFNLFHNKKFKIVKNLVHYDSIEYSKFTFRKGSLIEILNYENGVYEVLIEAINSNSEPWLDVIKLDYSNLECLLE